MFNPLVEDLQGIKDTDLENKINDLSKKYHTALRLGNGAVANQIAVLLEMYRIEQQRRYAESSKRTLKKQDKGLDDLINVE